MPIHSIICSSNPTKDFNKSSLINQRPCRAPALLSQTEFCCYQGLFGILQRAGFQKKFARKDQLMCPNKNKPRGQGEVPQRYPIHTPGLTLFQLREEKSVAHGQIKWGASRGPQPHLFLRIC